jgi:hypothetical protein
MVSPFCGAVKLAISTFSAVMGSVAASVVPISAELDVPEVSEAEPPLPLVFLPHDARDENTRAMQKIPAMILLNMISLLENVKLYDSMFKTEQKNYALTYTSTYILYTTKTVL